MGPYCTSALPSPFLVRPAERFGILFSVSTPPASTHASVRVATKPDEEALWRALYERNVGWVYRLLSRLGVPAEDRDDLAQRAFELAFRKGQAGLPADEVGPWLRGAIVNLVRNHRRWTRVRIAGRKVVESLFRPAREPNAAVEERSQIQAVLARMPERLRDVLVLSDVEDVPMERVAEMLRIPLNTARWHRAEARKMFRELWASMEEGKDA